MDFLLCRGGSGLQQMLHIHIPLEDIKDQDEAISKAQKIALESKEGTTVGLFTRDGNPICGWRVMKGGKLRTEPIEEIEHRFAEVGPGRFDFAKKQKEERQKRKSQQSKP